MINISVNADIYFADNALTEDLQTKKLSCLDPCYIEHARKASRRKSYPILYPETFSDLILASL